MPSLNKGLPTYTTAHSVCCGIVNLLQCTWSSCRNWPSVQHQWDPGYESGMWMMPAAYPRKTSWRTIWAPEMYPTINLIPLGAKEEGGQHPGHYRLPEAGLHRHLSTWTSGPTVQPMWWGGWTDVCMTEPGGCTLSAINTISGWLFKSRKTLHNADQTPKREKLQGSRGAVLQVPHWLHFLGMCILIVYTKSS